MLFLDIFRSVNQQLIITMLQIERNNCSDTIFLRPTVCFVNSARKSEDANQKLSHQTTANAVLILKSVDIAISFTG